MTRSRLLSAGLTAAAVLAALPASQADAQGGPPPRNTRPAAPAIRGTGPRDLSGSWTAARPADYAGLKLPPDVLPAHFLYASEKDEGQMVENIDDYLQPWAKAQRRNHIRLNDHVGVLQKTPENQCRPFTIPGEFQEGRGLGELILTPRLLIMQRWNESIVSFAHIGAEHPKDLKPSWLGHSVGRWEGDTLVVDTVGFNGQNTLFPGLPTTRKLHVVTSYRLVRDGTMLEVIYSYDDPGAFLRPFKFVRLFQRTRVQKGQESVCGQNNRET